MVLICFCLVCLAVSGCLLGDFLDLMLVFVCCSFVWFDCCLCFSCFVYLLVFEYWCLFSDCLL